MSLIWDKRLYSNTTPAQKPVICKFISELPVNSKTTILVLRDHIILSTENNSSEAKS